MTEAKIDIKDVNEHEHSSASSDTRYIPQVDRLKGCCGKTVDRRLIQLSASLILSIGVLSVSFYELTNSSDCDSLNSFYIGLISSIISVWITNSNSNSKKNK